MNYLKKLLVIVLAVGFILPLIGLTGCPSPTTTPVTTGEQPVLPNASAIAAYNLGLAQSSISKYDEAIAKFNEAIGLEPGYADAYDGRGTAYFNKGQNDSAIADYSKAIELGCVGAYYNRGLAYMKKAQNDLAIADFSKTIELDPKYANAYYNRGVAYSSNGQNDLAKADYTKTLQLTTNSALTQAASEKLASLGQSTTITTQTTTTTINGTGIPLAINTDWGPMDANILIDTDGTKYYNVPAITLMAHGGSPLSGYTWSKPIGGRFPPFGTIVDPNGVFRGSGGALAVGTYTFDVEVSDGSQTATAAYTITITQFERKPGVFDPGPPEVVFQQPELATFPLVDGKAGQPYAASLFVMGGEPPYSWFLDSDQGNFALSGLTIDMAGGIVRGTISKQLSGKTIKFRVLVKDHTGATDPWDASYPGPVYIINVR